MSSGKHYSGIRKRFKGQVSHVHNAAILQPPRPFKAIPHVSPHWLPLFSLFYTTPFKLWWVGKCCKNGLASWIQKLARSWCQPRWQAPCLVFISALLELPGGNVGGRDNCIMAALFITLQASVNIEHLASKSVSDPAPDQTIKNAMEQNSWQKPEQNLFLVPC